MYLRHYNQTTIHINLLKLVHFENSYKNCFFPTNQVAVLIGHLTRDADLVAVEVVGLLAAFIVCGCPIADFRQGVVAVVFVAVHQSVGRGDLVKVV